MTKSELIETLEDVIDVPRMVIEGTIDGDWRYAEGQEFAYWQALEMARKLDDEPYWHTESLSDNKEDNATYLVYIDASSEWHNLYEYEIWESQYIEKTDNVIAWHKIPPYEEKNDNPKI